MSDGTGVGLGTGRHRLGGRVACAGAALCVMILPSTGVDAQEPEAYRERVVELERRRDEARAQFHAVLERLGASATDTVFVGTLTMVTGAGARQLVRAGAELGWKRLRTWLGSDTLRLRGAVIHLRPAGTAAFERPRRADIAASLRPGATAEDVAALVQRLAGQFLVAQVDSELVNWSEALVFGPLRDAQVSAASVGQTAGLRVSYRELATSQLSRPRQCFLGDLDACRDALGLGVTQDPIVDWYAASDRRRWASQWLRVAVMDPRLRGSLPACLDEGNDAACIEFLRLNGHQRTPPMSGQARRTLLTFALASGGDGAYGRLIDGNGRPILERLAATARVSEDSLLAAWRAAVVAARPAHTTMTLATGSAAVVWIGIFLVVAARSTRWRSD